MFFSLILENAAGDKIDMTATANQYMTSQIEGLSPPPGTISTSSYAGMDGSKAGWVGLAKKFCILIMVVVAVRMDIMIGTTYIRDATCIGFCVNELLSIIENTSLMGIPYPPAIKKAIEVLQKRASHIDDEIQEMIDNMEDGKK